MRKQRPSTLARRSPLLLSQAPYQLPLAARSTSHDSVSASLLRRRHNGGLRLYRIGGLLRARRVCGSTLPRRVHRGSRSLDFTSCFPAALACVSAWSELHRRMFRTASGFVRDGSRGGFSTRALVRVREECGECRLGSHCILLFCRRRIALTRQCGSHFGTHLAHNSTSIQTCICQIAKRYIPFSGIGWEKWNRDKMSGDIAGVFANAMDTIARVVPGAGQILLPIPIRIVVPLSGRIAFRCRALLHQPSARRSPRLGATRIQSPARRTRAPSRPANSLHSAAVPVVRVSGLVQ